jgi:hypothetical protein
VCFLLIGNTIPLLENTNQESVSTNTSLYENCYGYVIPLPDVENISNNPDFQNNTLSLINDLLRQHIPVFWSNCSMEIIVKENEKGSIPHNYPMIPGEFIVPFTQNENMNHQIIAIMTDYSVFHELYTNISPVICYLLVEPIVISSCHQLTEPKIAFYFGDGVYSSSMNWYVSTLKQSGFLNNEYLDDTDIINQLNDGKYNLIIWPGGQYRNDLSSNISLVTRILRQYTIKRFVFNGGGYLGSCYGAYAASSGMRLFPFPLLSHYIPIIPNVGLFLGMQDSYTALALPCIFNLSIDQTTHPVLYGSKNQINGSELIGGCVYTTLGKNTQSLATVKEIDEITWYHLFRELFNSNNSLAEKILDLWSRFTIGKTIWTTSQYGQGKLVTFGDHPEIGDILLQRIVHNAIFYVTSKENNQIEVYESLPLNKVETIQMETKNLSLSTDKNGELMQISSQINFIYSGMKSINNHTMLILNQTRSLLEKGKIDWTLAINIYVSGIWEFTGTIQRALQYLNSGENTSNDNENILSSFEKINYINELIEKQNYSIHKKIINFKNNISKKLCRANESIKTLLPHMILLENELNSYDGSEKQNQSIVRLCDDLLIHSKNIEENLPTSYFDSLRMLRDCWYIYESNIL